SSLLGKNSSALKTGDAEPEPPATARLYSNRFCPFAQRVAIYLAKKTIRTEIVNINLMSKPDWYFLKNAKGSVPTFEYEGKVVYESLIIAEYLDGIFPSTSILPADPYKRARQKILVEQLSVVITGCTTLFLALKSDKEDAEVLASVKKCRFALDDCEKLACDNAPFFTDSAPGFPDYMTFPFFELLWVLITGKSVSNQSRLLCELEFG
ncbi:hypothetical protein PMAYCL1PPCAC_15092, partial [Pristionchus mayeri]